MAPALPAGLAALILLQAPAPPAPWSDLDPALDRADHVLLAEVAAVVPMGFLGAQIQVRPVEVLAGPGLPPMVAYLDHPRRPVRPGLRQLLLLARPGARDYHYRLVARVGGEDPHLAEKTAWLRRVLEIRRLPPGLRPGACVDFYLEALGAAVPWVRERGLGELERLREGRPAGLRRLLDPGRLERRVRALPAGPLRRRGEALLAWLRDDS